jgi:hypothetical protein
VCHQIAFIATHLQIEQPFLCRMPLSKPDKISTIPCAALCSSVTLVLSQRHPLFVAYFVACIQTSCAQPCSFVGADAKEYSFSYAWACLKIEWTLRVLCAARLAMLHPLELYTITRVRWRLLSGVIDFHRWYRLTSVTTSASRTIYLRVLVDIAQSW